jgi:hypothetical protein
MNKITIDEDGVNVDGTFTDDDLLNLLLEAYVDIATDLVEDHGPCQDPDCRFTKFHKTLLADIERLSVVFTK